MDYESGLNYLKDTIVQLEKKEALQLLENLRHQLASSSILEERQEAIRQLNRFACRYTGTSFDALCVQNIRPSPMRLLSLRQFLYLLIVIMILPGFGVVFAVPMNQQVEQIEEETQAIDRLVASGVAAPFYLNLLTPCSPTAQQQITVTRITISVGNRSDKGCVWTYTDTHSSTVILKDHWAGNGIYEREYLVGSSIIARDDFNQDSDTCFKRRTYFNNNLDFGSQCFSEAGIPDPSEAKFQNQLRSPIPPPFYWFFYR